MSSPLAGDIILSHTKRNFKILFYIKSLDLLLFGKMSRALGISLLSSNLQIYTTVLFRNFVTDLFSVYYISS